MKPTLLLSDLHLSPEHAAAVESLDEFVQPAVDGARGRAGRATRGRFPQLAREDAVAEGLPARQQLVELAHGVPGFASRPGEVIGGEPEPGTDALPLRRQPIPDRPLLRVRVASRAGRPVQIDHISCEQNEGELRRSVCLAGAQLAAGGGSVASAGDRAGGWTFDIPADAFLDANVPIVIKVVAAGAGSAGAAPRSAIGAWTQIAPPPTSLVARGPE